MPAKGPNPIQGALAGHGILVTRPAHQAEGLCSLIEAAGGRAWRFPVLEIQPVQDSAHLREALGRLSDYDIAIFVSANAVQHTLAALAPQPWPTAVRIAVVGAATARAVREQGLAVAICPDSAFNSEALLAVPELQQVQGRRILILRGDGGREHLREALLARGAQVDYLEVYRRVQTDIDPSELIARWQAGEIHAVTVSSNESLQKLHTIIGTLGAELLGNTTLVVASERTRELARSLGLSGPVVVAGDATDAAMADALERHFSAAKSGDMD